MYTSRRQSSKPQNMSVFSKFWSKIFKFCLMVTYSDQNRGLSSISMRMFRWPWPEWHARKSEPGVFVSDEWRPGDMVRGRPAWWCCRRSMGWRWNGSHPHPAALFCRQTRLHYHQTGVRAGNLSPWINFVRIKCMSLASLTGSVCVCVCVFGRLVLGGLQNMKSTS